MVSAASVAHKSTVSALASDVHVDNRFFAGTEVLNETLSVGAFLFLRDGTDQAYLEGTPSATYFRPFLEDLISSRLKCSEHTFVLV